MKIALSAATTQPSATSSVSGASAKTRKPRKKTTSTAIKKGSKKGAEIQTIDKDTIMINGIEIDIEKITDEQLYSLRKVLPRKDYRYARDNI